MIPLWLQAGFWGLVGALLDGIPESIVIEVSLIERGIVNWVTVAAIFYLIFPKDFPVQQE